MTTAQSKSPVPRKLNPSMIAALSEYIRKGNYACVACNLCGISEPAFYEWINLAQQDENNGLSEGESLYISLVKSIKKAEAEAEDLMVQTARNAAVQNKDGYLAITFNERRHPDRWGRKDRTRVDISETKRITITHVEVVLSEGGRSYIEGESRPSVEGLPDGRERHQDE